MRLPGYPAFLALCFALFGMANYRAVVYLQALIDLGTCLLIAGLAGKICGHRAGRIALLLAALCPFTANYVASPLTETLSIFCVALGFRALAEVLEGPRLLWTALLIFSWSYAALLRPDGALLAVVLWVALIVYGRHSLGLRSALRLAVIAGLLSVLPVCGLDATQLAHLPCLPAARAALRQRSRRIRRSRLCALGQNLCCRLHHHQRDLLERQQRPHRSRQSACARYGQRRPIPARPRRLLQDYNATTTLTPELDARFARLAQERIRAHPFRYYVTLPLLRLADMWLRPRVETLNVHLRWWQYAPASCGNLGRSLLRRAEPGLSGGWLFWGSSAGRGMAGAMVALIALRSLLLATLEAPEARYTLECFPLLFVLAACYLTTRVVPGGSLMWKTRAGNR